MIILLLFLLPLSSSFVAARSYCTLGPYYCEEFHTYTEAQNSAFLGLEDFATSYSCSHRVNHDFCQSCCVINGEKFTVFAKNHCNEGTFYFQQDCSDVVARGNVLGTVSVSGPREGITVAIGESSSLTLPDGRFSLPVPAIGTYTITFSDEQGRYSSTTRSISVTDITKDVHLDDVPLSAASTNQELHGHGSSATILEGYVRRDGWPLSLYTLKNGDQTLRTHLNGYFRFDNPTSTSLQVSGGGLSSAKTVGVSVQSGYRTFLNVVCNANACNVIATSSGTSTGPGSSGLSDLDGPTLAAFFLPGPPRAPGTPGTIDAGNDGSGDDGSHDDGTGGGGNDGSGDGGSSDDGSGGNGAAGSGGSSSFGGAGDGTRADIDPLTSGSTPSLCAETRSCYHYEKSDACTKDPCGISSYGCEWKSDHCLPRDLLESPVWAPCEECETFGACTRGSCEAIGGACTFLDAPRMSNGRMTRCVLDEVVACGSQGCLAKARAATPTPESKEATLTLVEKHLTVEPAQPPPPEEIGTPTVEKKNPIGFILFYSALFLLIALAGISVIIYRNNPPWLAALLDRFKKKPKQPEPESVQPQQTYQQQQVYQQRQVYAPKRPAQPKSRDEVFSAFDQKGRGGQ